jgi:hypothetical protein
VPFCLGEGPGRKYLSQACKKAGCIHCLPVPSLSYLEKDSSLRCKSLFNIRLMMIARIGQACVGIEDGNRFPQGESIILGNPGWMDDFEECQLYHSTVVQNMSTKMKSENQVLLAKTNKGSLLVD